MKYVLVIPDGMADYPVASIGGKTPLEQARTPHMDEVARRGRVGLVRTVPAGLDPGTDVATLSIFGYDPRIHYTGRAPLEALSQGVPLGPADLCFRMNFVTVADEKIVDYSAGLISTNEAKALVVLLNERLGNDRVRFHPGVSYRNLLVLRGGADLQVKTTPPHNIMDQPLEPHLPSGPGADLLTDLMKSSRVLFERHDINRVRTDLGENRADMIWLWGQGRPPSLPPFEEKYGKKAAVISAVDIVRGIGRAAGMEVVDVQGATGGYDTNYRGKGEAGLEALRRADLAIVHVEAPDDASHHGDLPTKIEVIERIDREIVGPVLEGLSRRPEHRVLVLPDHYNPVSKKTHTPEPVPFAICGKGIVSAREVPFSETSGNQSDLKIEEGHTLMEYFLEGSK